MRATDAATLLRAADFAAHKHRDQRRKDAVASPFINHPITLAHILANEGGIDEATVLIAALLHDTVEDTETTPAELEDMFGPDVAAIVSEVTDDKSLAKHVRKQRQVDHAAQLSHGAKLVKLADKIANVRDILEAPPAGWSAHRKRAYLDWATAVVAGLRGTHAGLESIFDALVQPDNVEPILAGGGALDLTCDFNYAAGKLFEGLRNLHQSAHRKIEFAALAKDLGEKLEEFDVVADLVDQYVDGKVESDKLGHFIETAVAMAVRAVRTHEGGSGPAWPQLCHAYFMGGTAALQINIARGARLRVQPYNKLKQTIIELVVSRCPEEKWASLEDMWRAIEEAVREANDRLVGQPGFSKDCKATFNRLARARRVYFQLFLSGPVRRGRPLKKAPRA
jgi:guanosine-3',5'-bis(diphosphate) 3'-pyrophosphohydrolase